MAFPLGIQPKVGVVFLAPFAWKQREPLVEPGETVVPEKHSSFFAGEKYYFEPVSGANAAPEASPGKKGSGDNKPRPI